MNELRGACIIGQSGGPSSVINASAYGVIDTALKSGAITQVLGAEHGIKGVLADRLFDMGRTTINIVGDAACAVIVSRLEAKKEAKKAAMVK